jgi:hypothetical protein
MRGREGDMRTGRLWGVGCGMLARRCFWHPSGVRFSGRRDPWGAVDERGLRPRMGQPPTAMIGHPSGMGERMTDEG